MNQNYPFVNPPLPYDYDALEPYIDTGTMILHHDAHLQTYVDNLNKLLRELSTVPNDDPDWADSESRQLAL